MQYYCAAARRLGSSVLREERIRGIGEVQSPGDSVQAKNAALGIYTVGQFPKASTKKMIAVILHKYLSAHIPLASLDPTKSVSKDSIGEIDYKLVDSVHGYQLNMADDLSCFVSDLLLP